MNHFGEKLTELRTEKNLSQMQLAGAVDISQSAIARYELNKTEPRISELKKICDYFDVSADYMIGRTDY